MKRVGMVVLLVVTGLAVVGCGGTDRASTTRPSSRPSSADGAIRIVDFTFQPADIAVPVGTTITWTNEDGVGHTTTAIDGAWDSSQIDPGGSFTTLLDSPGSFPYHCTIHPTMMGTITVES